MLKILRPSSRQAEVMARRLASVLSERRMEMRTFLRLVEIRVNKQVETAAISGDVFPVLFLNPDFVRQHCKRDEHLFLLVLHEMQHLLLGHISLIPDFTMAHNIACDALINAGLCDDFPGERYTSFFTDLYLPDTFPHMLLRPPHGWPYSPKYIGPPALRHMMKRLYRQNRRGGKTFNNVTFSEILDLMIRMRGKLAEHGIRESMEVVLLGDHEWGWDGSRRQSRARTPLDYRLRGLRTKGAPHRDDHFWERIRDSAERWPIHENLGGWMKTADSPEEWSIQRAAPHSIIRAEFALLLRKICGPVKKQRILPTPAASVGRIRAEGNLGVLPSAKDRTRAARLALGGSPMLWTQCVNILQRGDEMGTPIRVYLDVSGSMGDILPVILGLLLPYATSHQIQVFQFSDEVMQLDVESLRRGSVKTTYGTDVDCILEDLVDFRTVKKAVIITDGWVDEPNAGLLQRVRERRIRIHSIVAGESQLHSTRAMHEVSDTVHFLKSML